MQDHITRREFRASIENESLGVHTQPIQIRGLLILELLRSQGWSPDGYRLI